MKYKYIIYASGKAGTIQKFYSKNSLDVFNIEYLVYDGGDLDVTKNLNSFLGDKLCIPQKTKFDFPTKGHYSNYLSTYINSLMKDSNVNYMFCFGNTILRNELLREFQFKIINFHPSILPSFRGLNAIDQALNSNSPIIGNTAHFIDSGIDTGPVICQNAILIENFLDYSSVLDLQVPMLEKIWHWLELDDIQIVGDKVVLLSGDFRFDLYG